MLTNAAGRTLYWFAPDTPTKSVCNGSCAVYWPPVRGPLTAGAGVSGQLSTIKRADGSTQETYDGHPLYTYVADSGPGQAHGNNLNLNGGLWHVVVVARAIRGATLRAFVLASSADATMVAAEHISVRVKVWRGLSDAWEPVPVPR